MAKRGRPKRKINLKLVEKLASIQCTSSEISAIIDIPIGTLATREDYQNVYKKGLEKGKMSLRRIQFRMAETSPAMAIWLGKQYLGQAERIEVANTELMKEELEIIPSNNKFKDDIKSRISKFINN